MAGQPDRYNFVVQAKRCFKFAKQVAHSFFSSLNFLLHKNDK